AVYERFRDRFEQAGSSNHSNTPKINISQPERDAQPSTEATAPVFNSPQDEKVSAVARTKHPIVNMDGTLVNPTRTILARTFSLSGDDITTLLSAYPSNRQKTLSAEIIKLHKNKNTRKRAHDLLQLALEVARSGNAPNLNKGLGLDARMFW